MREINWGYYVGKAKEVRTLPVDISDAALLDLSQQIGESGVTGDLDAQHQRVDEEADEVVEGRITSPGDRKAHRHIGGSADLRQQHGERRLHHHEAGRVVLSCHLGDLPLQLGRPLDRHGGAALVGNQGVGPVCRQLQALGQPGQRALPVRHLRGDRTVGITQVAELCVLPERVVGVLHGQLDHAGGRPTQRAA